MFFFALTASVQAQSEDDLLDAIGAELESEKKASKEAEKNLKEYQSIQKKADGYFRSKNYDKAKPLYEQMAKLMPKEDYPNTQLQRIKVAEEEEKKKAEEEALKAKEDEYAGFISWGDDMMASKEYEEAIKVYKQAKDLIDKPEVNNKIKAAEKAIADEKAALAKAQAKSNFESLVAKGDEQLAAKKFAAARAAYKEALDMNFDNSTANAKIKAVDDQEAEAKAAAELAAKTKEFDDLMASGQSLLSKQSFDAAAADFSKAAGLGINDAEANAKLKEVEAAKKAAADAAAAAALKKEFDDLIAKGDGALGSEDYDGAIKAYKAALALGADNATAESKVASAESAKKAAADAAAAAALKKEFDDFIAKGDGALGSEDYDGAIGAYQSALALGVDNATAESKVASAESAKKAAADAAAAAAQQAEFNDLIAKGDGALGSEDYDGAIGAYQSALALGVDNATAESKVTSAESAKKAAADAAAAAAQQAEFNDLIAKGDGALGSEDFDGAIGAYQAALALGVDNATAESKVASAESAKKAAADAAAAAAQQAEFNDLIAKGDGALGSEDYDGAIGAYQAALALGVDNAAAERKVASAESAKKAAADAAAAAAQQAEFNELIAKGDGALGSEDYDGAIGAYQAALALGVDNATAESKVASAESAKKAAADAAAAAAQQAEFNDLIAKGDDALGTEDFDGAIGAYQAALALGVDNATAESKVASAESALRAQQAAADLAEKEALFQQKIKEGDALLASSDYTGAERNYKEAQNLDIDNELAQQKIDAVNTAREESLKALAAEEKQGQYNLLIEEGNSALGSKEYDLAIDKYSSALNMGVNNSEAEGLIAKAKSAKQQASLEAEALAVASQVSDLMVVAEGALANESYQEAIQKYTEVLGLDPDNSKAKEGRELAQSKLNQQNEASEAAKAAEVELQQQWAGFIAAYQGGKRQYENGQYEQAISELEIALSKKPATIPQGESVPDVEGLIQECEKEIESAKNIANAHKIAMQATYEAEMESAQLALGNQNFEEAIVAVNAAIETDYNTPEANALLDEINRAQLAFENEKAALASAQEEELRKQERISSLMISAEKAFDQKNYEETIKYSNEILSLEASHLGAIEYKQQAEQELALLKEKEMAAAEKERVAAAAVTAAFTSKMKEANAALGNQNFDQAINLYKEAKTINPSSNEPDEKIATAEQMKSDYLAQQEAESQKLAEESKNLALYQENIELANQAMANNDYEATKRYAEKAKEIDPTQPEVSAIFAAIASNEAALAAQQKQEEDARRIAAEEEREKAELAARQEAEEAERLAQIKAEENRVKAEEQRLKQEEFTQLVSAADRAFKLGNYQKAYQNYLAATEIIPESPDAQRKMQIAYEKMKQNSGRGKAGMPVATNDNSSKPHTPVVHPESLLGAYKDGVTVERESDWYRDVLITTVVKDGVAFQLWKVTIKGGYTYYLYNGKSIDKSFYEYTIRRNV